MQEVYTALRNTELDKIGDEIYKANNYVERHKNKINCFIYEILTEDNKTYFFRCGYMYPQTKSGYRIIYECYDNINNKFIESTSFGQAKADIRMKFHPYLYSFIESISLKIKG